MLPEGVTIAHPDKLYIGGQWVAPHSGRQLEMVSPNTEQVVARFEAERAPVGVACDLLADDEGAEIPGLVVGAEVG